MSLFRIPGSALTKRYIYILISFCVLGACSSAPSSATLPVWVLQTPAGCGVGSVRLSGSMDLALAKTGATSRGRDALARELQTRVESVIRTYRSEGNREGELSEELVVDVSRQSSRAMLSGTRAREVFLSNQSPQSIFVLVCYDRLSRPSLTKSLSRLPSIHRVPIRQRAEASFAELESLMEGYDLMK